jgi:hypothetical protein
VSRLAKLYAIAVLSSSAAILAVPPIVAANTGGAGVGGNSVSASKTAATPTAAEVQSGNVMVSASGNGITITTRASALLHSPAQFTGTVPSAAAGKVVEIERSGRETGGVWRPTTHATAAPDGSFTAVWPTNHIGRFQIRAVIENKAGTEPSSPTLSPTVTITAYRPSKATQYGPGFYGQTTACGEVLRQQTMGVANRTLPCGTNVAVYYHGRTLVIPVIDRGPYANGADWDLTEATGRALGIDGTAMIGAVSLPGQ